MAKKETKQKKKAEKVEKLEVLVGGAPSKINAFIKCFEEQMEIDKIAQQVIFLTDAEFVFLINEMLPEPDQISQRTFERWKAKNAGERQENAEELDDIGQRFCRLYKKVMITQKAALFNKLTSKTELSWQKYAWIIERKFSEWNIRQISEVNHNVNAKQVVITKNYNEKLE